MQGEHLTIQLLWAAARLLVTLLALATQWMMEMRMWGSSKIKSYCICLVWNREKRREKEFKIPLCNPSGRNLLLRQGCTHNSIKHQQQSSSAKTANNLNMLTVPTKRLHHRLSTGLQVWIWLKVLWVWGVSGLSGIEFIAAGWCTKK